MLGPLILLLSQTVGGQYDPILSVYGTDHFDKIGLGESDGVGDINGDGIDDFLVGNPFSTDKIVYLYSGSDLSVLRSYDNGGIGGLGKRVAHAGDVDADGAEDYLIAASDLTVNGMTWAGEVYLYSGATGTLLQTFQGQQVGHHLGYVGPAGDVDNDGHDDFFIGAYQEDWGGFEDAGVLYVYSGNTYQVLHQVHGNSDFAFWGRSFSGGFDVDLDGYDDFMAGSSDESIAHVYSGFDGSILYTKTSTDYLDRLGNAVCLVPDSNADGTPDFCVASFGKAIGGISSVGVVELFSGLDGSLLHAFEGDGIFGSFGENLLYAGDVDGNGNPDLAVGSSGSDILGMQNCGSVQVFDLITRERIYLAAGSSSSRQIGEFVRSAGDITGDGNPNLITGEPFYSNNGLTDNGAVHVLDFHPGLAMDQVDISAAAGGTVNFEIDFPEHSWNLPYKLLGSHTGIGPSPFGNIEIPLSTSGVLWDAMLRQPAPPVFTGADGILDSNGDATARLVLPAGIASGLVGSVFHFSVVSRFFNEARQSSIAVPLTILP